MKSGARALQRRLRSVRSIAQLTRAMKTVAVSKYNRALVQWRNIRPYQEALKHMAAMVGTSGQAGGGGTHVLYVLITANRGMCGVYNSDLWSFFRSTSAEQDAPWRVLLLGNWGVQRAREQLPKDTVLGVLPMNDLPRAEDAWALADRLEDEWASGQYGSIVLVAQAYENVLRQVPTATTIFPRQGLDASSNDDLLVLPERDALSAEIRNRDLRTTLYEQMLASMTGAHGAMLMAMRSANDNAETMGDAIERRMNRLRQTAVTTQVLELSRGAQSNT